MDMTSQRKIISGFLVLFLLASPGVIWAGDPVTKLSRGLIYRNVAD